MSCCQNATVSLETTGCAFEISVCKLKNREFEVLWNLVLINKQTYVHQNIWRFFRDKNRARWKEFFLFSNEASKILDVVKTEMFARRSVYPPGGHFHCLTGFIHKDLLCPWNHYNRYDINFTYDLK